MDRARDAVINKRMASVFHDSPIPSLLVWHKVDTVILTGGSTSGCVRASAVSSLSHGYRTIVYVVNRIEPRRYGDTIKQAFKRAAGP